MRIVIIFCLLFCFVPFSSGYSILDTVEGWASMNGGTTGGIGGDEVTVSTSDEFIQAATSTDKKIILVKKGNYNVGRLLVQSNKSILGLEPGIVVDGTVAIRDNVHNVIIRNIAFINSKKCNSYKACQSGPDAMNIMYGAHNVWLDHLDISDGQDGNLDITRGSDFITVTWCKFSYSYPKPHAFSNLIAGSGGEVASRGKLKITYAFCWWADNIQQRQPYGRFGKIHLLNCLWTSQRTKDAACCSREMQMLVEHGVFNCSGVGFRPDGGDFKLIGNIGTNKHITGSKGTVFTPPYKQLSQGMDASEVEAKVKAGAGNNLTLNREITKYNNCYSEKAAILPYVTNTASGWMLHNPTASKLTFTTVALNGRTVVPRAHILAGKSMKLPLQASTMLLISFKGAHAQTNGYLLNMNGAFSKRIRE